jgi:[ribosomal protein S18]-alanine N-acetyltransferase
MNALISKPEDSHDPQDAQDQQAQFEPMLEARLDAVLRVELTAYPHPWSRGNFSDSIRAGYYAQLLTSGQPDHRLLGYFVAMQGAGEVHLLNLTVAPEFQGQGWAILMLDALALWARGQRADWLWLEVRQSNERAKAVYERYGFNRVATRPNYYPAGTLDAPARETAVVMSLPL